MLYDRKIKYLDYYEGGTKVNGGGFAKLEVRGNTLRLELTVRGLHPTDSFERDIVLQGAEKEAALGQIRIQNGSGQFRYSCDADQGIGTTGISYSELRGIRIPIGGTREILCQWGNATDRRRITPPEKDPQKSEPDLQESRRESTAESYADSKADSKTDSEVSVYTENEQVRESTQTEKAEEKRLEAKEEYESIEGKNKKDEGNKDDEGNIKNRGNIEGEGNKADKGNKVDIGNEEDGNKDDEGNIKDKRNIGDEGNKKDKESTDDKKKNGESKEKVIDIFRHDKQPGDQSKDELAMAENNPAEQTDMKKAPVKLMEDKWQQLSAIYPHIQPFRDERDYLSLTPSDFVLFPDRFYRAVNNSFLLHGYYNYHHLILARIERRGDILYYIGVPGNYFEREKQVAIMFGFESFECETEPAKTGDFGYYMMRTEL